MWGISGWSYYPTTNAHQSWVFRGYNLAHGGTTAGQWWGNGRSSTAASCWPRRLVRHLCLLWEWPLGTTHTDNLRFCWHDRDIPHLSTWLPSWNASGADVCGHGSAQCSLSRGGTEKHGMASTTTSSCLPCWSPSYTAMYYAYATCSTGLCGYAAKERNCHPLCIPAWTKYKGLSDLHPSTATWSMALGWDRSTVHPSYILGMLRLPQWWLDAPWHGLSFGPWGLCEDTSGTCQKPRRQKSASSAHSRWTWKEDWRPMCCGAWQMATKLRHWRATPQTVLIYHNTNAGSCGILDLHGLDDDGSGRSFAATSMPKEG